MPEPADPTYTHVLGNAPIRWAIRQLIASKCHSSFLLYLFLRRSMIETGGSSDLNVDMSAIKDMLWLAGGPPNKPMFRPLSDRSSEVSTGWITKHLAGSYAFSSLRGASEWLMNDTRSEYQLPVDHVERARHAFLYDEPLSALALGTFLMRDGGFTLSCADGHPEDLVAAFRDTFAFAAAADADFDRLFHADVPPTPAEWFDPAEEAGSR